MYGQQLEEQVSCPYCGETLLVLIDSSLPHQEYIEDCQVCCRPINFKVQVVDDVAEIQVFSEDE